MTREAKKYIKKIYILGGFQAQCVTHPFQFNFITLVLYNIGLVGLEPTISPL